ALRFFKREKAEESCPIEKDHRQDRSELNEDIERIRLVPFKAEEMPGDDQMTGRRDRDKFGEPFHQAENQRLQQFDHRTLPPRPKGRLYQMVQMMSTKEQAA